MSLLLKHPLIATVIGGLILAMIGYALVAKPSLYWTEVASAQLPSEYVGNEIGASVTIIDIVNAGRAAAKNVTIRLSPVEVAATVSPDLGYSVTAERDWAIVTLESVPAGSKVRTTVFGPYLHIGSVMFNGDLVPQEYVELVRSSRYYLTIAILGLVTIFAVFGVTACIAVNKGWIVIVNR